MQRSPAHSDPSAIQSCQSIEPFADIFRSPIDKASPIVAGRPALVIFEADGLPAGQQWLKPGEQADPSEEIAARIEARRERPIRASAGYSTSVVICTRDRPEELRRCLASFADQSWTPDELIVVDNASRDQRTRDVVLSAGATYIREDRPGLDFARNSGARAAHGDIVLYTDDDTELHERWVESTIAAFDAPDIMAVTGLVLPARLDTEAQWIFETEWSFGRGFDRIDYGYDFFSQNGRYGCPAWIVGAGANMAFRRIIFDRVGYFDERLDVGQAGCSGDSEFWYRILAAGYICRYEPLAVMFHHHRLEMSGLASQIYHYMRGHTAALMVQYQRTGETGNLRRAFVLLPKYYLGLLANRLKNGLTNKNRFLAEQIKGAAAGIWFFIRNRQMPAPPAESSDIPRR
ncbi:glycosyltransferase family 2 protein [Croceicoccus hydrothermalis]|uniref:glycosyltransferase family 2 protein n=1 Tax=Croceicoccus hydrothermalis TaxID=2867964 RepID=UPI001EFB9DA5|nr:glycosyltransferase family A protein [Croceicoccus hydrothermalis]